VAGFLAVISIAASVLALFWDPLRVSPFAILLALIAVGVAANVRTRFTDPLRAGGFALGLLGAASTFFALARYFNATSSDHNIFYNASWGLWMALAGFVIGGVGAVIGPGRAT